VLYSARCRSLRIEVVCSSRELFGSDRSAVRLAQVLEHLGHSVRLAVPRARPERGLTAFASSRGLEIAAAPIAVASRRGITGLGRSARPSRGSANRADLTIYNSAAVVGRAGDRRPRLLVLREWLPARSSPHRALAAHHARRVDAVVAVSRAVEGRWRALIGDAVPTEVCPNWLGPEWFEDEGAPASEAGAREGVLFIGRLNRWKGQSTLADAFELAFAGSASRPSLTFLGAEPDGGQFPRDTARLRRRCERSGWRMLEFRRDPRRLIRHAALIVAPSLRPEPFGNVILEAIAGGARVIAFPGGGVDDLAPLFPGVLRVVPRDTRALADALADWAATGAPAQTPAQFAISTRTIKEHFTTESAMERWRTIMERLEA